MRDFSRDMASTAAIEKKIDEKHEKDTDRYYREMKIPTRRLCLHTLHAYRIAARRSYETKNEIE